MSSTDDSSPVATIKPACSGRMNKLPADDVGGLASTAHKAAARRKVVHLTNLQGRIAAIAPLVVAVEMGSGFTLLS
jgi:hypothetical protein